MAEILNELEAPVFVERVSLADAGRLMKARKAIRKALRNQVEGRGFSFVEILSPCPINWKMSPVEAREWIKTGMEEVFPVKNFRDLDAPAHEYKRMPWLEDEDLYELLGIKRSGGEPAPEAVIGDAAVKIAGFGGQGVMSAGILLANCAIERGFASTWLPSYGPEMRGGSANAGVVISSNMIGSPVVDRPDCLIAMNGPSLDRFEDTVKPGGSIIYNSSLINRAPNRDDVTVTAVPATELAKKVGFTRGANIIMLAVYLHTSQLITVDTLRRIIPLSLKREEYTAVNLKMVDAGVQFVRPNG